MRQRGKGAVQRILAVGLVVVMLGLSSGCGFVGGVLGFTQNNNFNHNKTNHLDVKTKPTSLDLFKSSLGSLQSVSTQDIEKLQTPKSINASVNKSEIDVLLKRSESDISTLGIHVNGKFQKFDKNGNLIIENLINYNKPYLGMLTLPEGKFLLNLIGNNDSNQSISVDFSIKNTVISSILMSPFLFTRNTNELNNRKKWLESSSELKEMSTLMEKIISEPNVEFNVIERYDRIKNEISLKLFTYLSNKKTDTTDNNIQNNNFKTQSMVFPSNTSDNISLDNISFNKEGGLSGITLGYCTDNNCLNGQRQYIGDDSITKNYREFNLYFVNSLPFGFIGKMFVLKKGDMENPSTWQLTNPIPYNNYSNSNPSWSDAIGKIFGSTKPNIIIFPASFGIGVGAIVKGTLDAVENKNALELFKKTGPQEKIFSFDLDADFTREDIFSVSEVTSITETSGNPENYVLKGHKVKTRYVLEVRSGLGAFDESTKDEWDTYAAACNVVHAFFLLFELVSGENVFFSTISNINDFAKIFNAGTVTKFVAYLKNFEKDVYDGIQEYNILKFSAGLYRLLYLNKDADEYLKKAIDPSITFIIDKVIKTVIDQELKATFGKTLSPYLSSASAATKASYSLSSAALQNGYEKWVGKRLYNVFSVIRYYGTPYIFDTSIDDHSISFKTTLVSPKSEYNKVFINNQPILVKYFTKIDNNPEGNPYIHAQFTIDLLEAKKLAANKPMSLHLESRGVRSDNTVQIENTTQQPDNLWSAVKYDLPTKDKITAWFAIDTKQFPNPTETAVQIHDGKTWYSIPLPPTNTAQAVYHFSKDITTDTRMPSADAKNAKYRFSFASKGKTYYVERLSATSENSASKIVDETAKGMPIQLIPAKAGEGTIITGSATPTTTSPTTQVPNSIKDKFLIAINEHQLQELVNINNLNSDIITTKLNNGYKLNIYDKDNMKGILVFKNGDEKVFWIHDGIYKKFIDSGGTTNLGFPTTNELAGYKAPLVYQEFDGGGSPRIYWTGKDTFVMKDGIRNYWKDHLSELGFPASDELNTPYVHQKFESGKAVCWLGFAFICPIEKSTPEDLGKLVLKGKFSKITQPYLDKYYGSEDCLRGYHPGIDYRAAVGTPVYAPVTGTVSWPTKKANLDSLGTIAIKINGGSRRIIFLHMSTSEVQAGDSVNAGDKIGLSGATGAAPHLHVEVRNGRDNGACYFKDPANTGVNINPIEYGK